MRTLKLTLAYDGTDYAGWQSQPGRPTIQAAVEAACRQILQERVHVAGSGRTDAGVHALGQVAHLRTSRSLPCQTLQRGLNAVLPRDIVVRAVEEAPPDFHARFDAVSKRYRYRIVNGPVVLPFMRRYVHHVPVQLNVALMRREAAVLRGRHDFRSFHNTGRLVTDTVRTLSLARIERRRGELVIELEANGFLQGMARAIVGTLLELGRGRLPAGSMARILRAKRRQAAGPTAPARGLILVHADYR
ncbi:MAG: tRNA pseudouridine(38-40) synthase TruA [Candidatus Omnitrophica bacterium]|nr:tRNA pseudouridine(38-40) synthase TruA [Candidatus Omnitrophota bacterium]